MKFSGPTVVLVHGSWHNESCWSEVRTHLATFGVASRALTLPSTNPLAAVKPTGINSLNHLGLPGVSADLAAVTSLVDSIKGPVMLCGHGYGGMVISEVGNNHKVRRLVYLAGFCPDRGESMFGLTRSLVGGPYAHSQWTGPVSTIDPDTGRWLLYSDSDRPRAATLASELLPSTSAITRFRSLHPAWHAKPTTYVICLKDRALMPSLQREMAYRVVRAQLANGWNHNHSVAIDTGHCPFYSEPRMVAELLVQSAAPMPGHAPPP